MVKELRKQYLEKGKTPGNYFQKSFKNVGLLWFIKTALKHLETAKALLRWLVPVFRILTARNFSRIEQKGRPGPLKYFCRFGLYNLYLT